MRMTKLCKTYELWQLHIRLNFDTLTAPTKNMLFWVQNQSCRALRAMKDQWWENKGKGLQSFADCNDSWSFYQAIKIVYGPSKQSTSQLLSMDGTSILTEKSEHLKRCQEHFHELLNRPRIFTVEALGKVHSQPIQLSLDDPHIGWSHQRAKIQQNTRAWWHCSRDIPVQWWHTDIMHASTVHKVLGSSRTTARPLRCINHDHLQEQGRQERLQQFHGILPLSLQENVLQRSSSATWCPTLLINILAESQCGFQLSYTRWTWFSQWDSSRRNVLSNRRVSISLLWI